jgi:thiopurine S-methyltransferase
MESEFWLERWRLAETGFHQPVANRDLQRHWPALALAPGTTVFVPLCGKSLDLLWLRAQGHRVIGIELAEQAVRDFHRENALTPAIATRAGLPCWETDGLSIYCADFFALHPVHLATTGAVYDRAALIALPPELRRRYARHLQSLLPAGAQILQLTMDYPQEQMQGPPFSVGEAELRDLYGARFQIRLLGSNDTLLDEPRFRQRGLRSLQECSYRLAPLDRGEKSLR